MLLIECALLLVVFIVLGVVESLELFPKGNKDVFNIIAGGVTVLCSIAVVILNT